MKKKQITPANALERLEELCSQSEQCSADIRNKLYRWGMTAADSEKILNSLIDTRFVDDNRFAAAYVRDKYRFSGWGRIKISAGLRSKRIPAEIITDALTQVDLREYAAVAMKVMRSRLRSLQPKGYEDYELRRRLYIYGTGRGFESALVAKIINSRSLWISDRR